MCLFVWVFVCLGVFVSVLECLDGRGWVCVCVYEFVFDTVFLFVHAYAFVCLYVEGLYLDLNVLTFKTLYQ